MKTSNSSIFGGDSCPWKGISLSSITRRPTILLWLWPNRTHDIVLAMRQSAPFVPICGPLHSILKSRDITLPTKVHLVKAMVFPVVMYGCERWTVKKAEHRRIDAFELWCWRRLLRVPWTARRSNQSILKISPGCSLEGLMLKLKLQYFGHLMQRADSLEKTLMLGGIGSRRRGWQRMNGWMASPTRWTWVCVNSGSWWWTGRPGVLQFMGSQKVGHDWATELNWTEVEKCFAWLWDREAILPLCFFLRSILSFLS